MAGARQIVAGPEFTASRHSLWDAVQQRPAEDPHWQQGVIYETRCPAGGTVMDECLAVTGTGGAPAAQGSLTATTSQTNRGATAFTVYAEFDCSPVGQEQAADRAREALAKVEEWQISRTFWTGESGASGGTAQVTAWPHLAAASAFTETYGTQQVTLQTAATVVTGGGPSQDAAVALGVLEQGLSDCYHGQGLIHVPPLAVPTLKARALIHKDDTDGRFYTANGNRVVIGSGYPGTSPSGAAPGAGQSWLYATGAVFGYRSEVVFRGAYPESFDRAENTLKMIAYRTYLFGWECCHLAVLVDLGVPVSGGSAGL